MANNQPDKIAPQLVMDLLRLIGYVISKSVWFIRYTDRKNIPGKKLRSFLICANHQTYVDPVWVCLPMRRKLRFMAFDKAFEWRFIGPLIRYLGAFPVSQETSGTLNAIRIALRELKQGSVLT
ncbi:MAG: 1-acyl-sn-glycerol-3-phosphate acyltransferase, partial [Pyrinomonadaceae bacterium]|nr:1-acyl-sn-glycerol-3-phosphate acyltransferase [Pyrinomonadaceae bacterium]